MPSKFWGVQMHPLKLGRGVSKTPCFIVFFEGRPLNLEGEFALPKFGWYGQKRVEIATEITVIRIAAISNR